MKPLSRSNRIMTESKRRNLNCWISGHSGYLVLHIFMIGIACTADRNCYTRHFQSMGLDSKNPDCHWGCLTPPVGRKRNNLFSSQTRQIEVEASLLECLSAVRWPTALCIINHHPTSRRDLIQRSNKYVNWIHKMYTSLTAQLYWLIGLWEVGTDMRGIGRAREREEGWYMIQWGCSAAYRQQGQGWLTCHFGRLSLVVGCIVRTCKPEKCSKF